MKIFGVYKDWEALYIGQCDRNIETEIKEHSRSGFHNNSKVSASRTDCIENSDFIDKNDVKLLYFENKGKRLNLLKQYFKHNWPDSCTEYFYISNFVLSTVNASWTKILKRWNNYRAYNCIKNCKH